MINSNRRQKMVTTNQGLTILNFNLYCLRVVVKN